MGDYDFPPYRPPNEAGSVLVRASRGCPWNKCAFCNMYKSMSFEIKPLDEVLSDIEKARNIYGKDRKHVFIADSNSVIMKDLPCILRHLREVFPGLERVTSYARAKSLRRLGVEKLKELKEAGLTRVHIGLESGDSVVLERLQKGAKPDDMILGALAAKEAGLEVSEYVLLGAGGSDRFKEHGRETARVLNAIDPEFIRFRTLTILPGTPLWNMKENGEFVPVKPAHRLEETLIIVSNLTGITSAIVSDHVSNNLWSNHLLIYRGIDGSLPKDRDIMISHINNTLNQLNNTVGEIRDSEYMLRMGLMMGL